jgi:hypothetical protein
VSAPRPPSLPFPIMTMQKYVFSRPQRYAVWLHHEKRCWLCKEPLSYKHATVDHVIPEYLLDDPAKLNKILTDYGLPSSYQINGYENWLPAHSHCNSTKSSRVDEFIPSYRPIFERLMQYALRVRRTAEAIERDQGKAKVLTRLLHALDTNTVSVTDITDLLSAYVHTNVAVEDNQAGPIQAGPVQAGPKVYIRLDNGYLIERGSISFEGFCECENPACVGKDGKAFCYWPDHISAWAKRKYLFHRCFDELIPCPRCGLEHRRGDVGRDGTCAMPYTDQENQVDLHGSQTGPLVA